MAASNSKSSRQRSLRSSEKRPVRASSGETPSKVARQAFSEELPQEEAVSPEAKLVCVEGSQLGAEYLLAGEEMVVGRSPENAIPLPDNSVSRKHLLLRQTAEGWMASDMGSGNGTLINEKPINEETLLKNGDRIILGDTEFEFVSQGDEGERRSAKGSGSGAALAVKGGVSQTEAQKQRSAKGSGSSAALEPRRSSRQSLRARRQQQEGMETKKKRRKLLLGVLGFMLILLGVGVVVKWKEAEKQDELRKRMLLQQQYEEELNARFQDAKNFVRVDDWLKAKDVFLGLQEEAPSYRMDEIQGFLKEAEREVPNQMAMSAAEDALVLLELKEANTRLGEVTETKHQYERLMKLKQKLQEALGKKVAMAKNLASQTTNRDSMVKLNTMADDILAVVPMHRDAMDLQGIAKEALHRIDHPVRPPPVPETPWVAVSEKYKAGEMEEAVRLVSACAPKHARCKKMQSLLEEFSNKDRRIEALSAQEFFALYELDRQLSEGVISIHTRRIVSFAIPAVEKRAREAKLGGHLGEAAGLAMGLLKMDSKNATAQSLMDEVRAKAKETYLRAYTLRATQPEQAEQFFKEVIQMLPKGEEYAQRAQEQLRALKRDRVPDEE
ncbi:MAG: FHA domain-containing protein [Cystobacterineae bacterium]|nr:FHA domain-containing protein [Cystobacterineae bacterium]